MNSFGASNQLQEFTSNLASPGARKYRTLDTQLIDNMLGDHESRLERMLMNIKPKDNKSVAHPRHKQKQQVVTIVDGIKSARLALPRIVRPQQYTPNRKSIDVHSSRQAPHQVKQTQLFDVYGQRRRRSLVASGKALPQPIYIKPSAHLLPSRLFNSSPKPSSEQQIVNNMDVYYLELEEMMTADIGIAEMIQAESKIRELKKRYSHLAHVDKEYYMAHTKLDLALVRNRSTS